MGVLHEDHSKDNVEKYGRAGQDTDDNIIWHMCCCAR